MINIQCQAPSLIGCWNRKWEVYWNIKIIYVCIAFNT